MGVIPHGVGVVVPAEIERLVEARQAEDPKYDRLDLIREAIDHALAGKCHGFKEG